MGGSGIKITREGVGVAGGAFVAPHIHRSNWRPLSIETHQRMPVTADAHHSHPGDIGTERITRFLHAFANQAANPVRIAHAAAVGSDLEAIALTVLGVHQLTRIGIKYDGAHRG